MSTYVKHDSMQNKYKITVRCLEEAVWWFMPFLAIILKLYFSEGPSFAYLVNVVERHFGNNECECFMHIYFSALCSVGNCSSCVKPGFCEICDENFILQDGGLCARK